MKIIGVYRKPDFVTMSGGAFSVTGIILAMRGHIYWSILCMLLALLCDGFDGVVARRGKYVDYQSVYGTELDSLCDVVSFGILPMVIVQNITSFNVFSVIASIIFCICGIVRLAYFNMLSITKKSDGKSFIGFPIVISAVVLPIVYFVLEVFKINLGNIIYPVVLLVCGALFVVPVKLKKLNTRERLICALFGLVFVIILSFVYCRFK